MNKGIVYKIEVGDELYIGSTEEKLCVRQGSHNRDLKKFPHRKLYKACIDNGVDKIKCWWVADIVFNSYVERRAIEETYRKELNAKLNSIRCYRSHEEKKEDRKQYNLDHKEELKEYKKQYQLDHKEELKEYKKQYHIDHKEEINQYKLDHKEKITEYQKQYKLDHKEKLAEQQKQYRLDHKEKIAEIKRLYNIKNRDIINAKARAKRKEKKLLKDKSS